MQCRLLPGLKEMRTAVEVAWLLAHFECLKIRLHSGTATQGPRERPRWLHFPEPLPATLDANTSV